MTPAAPSSDPSRRSLRTRLAFRITALALTASVVSALIVFIAAGRIVSDQIRDNLVAAAADREQDLARLIDERLSDVVFGADVPGLARDIAAMIASPSDSAAMRRASRRLQSTVGDNLNFDEIFVDALPDARVVLSTRPERTGVFEALPTYFLRGREAPFVQEVYSSSEDLRPVLSVAAPILMTGTDDVVGVLVGHVNLNRIEELVQQTPDRDSSVEAYLVSEAGDFVSADRFGRDGFRLGPTSPGIEAALAGQTGVASYDNYAGVPVLGAYRWLPDRRMALMMEVPASEALVPARRLGLIVLFTGLVATAVIAIVGLSLARDIARPLEVLVEATDRVAEGDFSVDLPPGGNGEIGRLSDAFVQMTRQLQTSYRELERQVSVSERALGEAESSRQVLQAIVDNSTSLIGVCGQDGLFQLANSRLTELLGAGPILPGQKVDGLVPDSVSRLALTLTAQALGERRPVETEFEVELAGGTHHFFAVVFPLQPEEPDSAVGFIALDRTDRVQAEINRTNLESQLRQSQKLESLGLLAGGVAHDFNNLLQAIVGHASLLEEDGPSESAAQHLGAISVATQRASDLTGQLLAYAGKRSLRSENVSINRALNEISELVAVSVPKTATITRDLDPDAGAVQADPAQIGQVLMNLVTNAADALVDGRGEVRIRTRGLRLATPRPVGSPSSEELADGDYVQVMVEDTGIGMDAETQSRIFDPFFTTKDAGRGLGLAAVMGIVNGGRGHLTVESTLGKGSRFTVLFPRTPDEPAPVQPAEERERVLKGARILVADDEGAVLEFLTTLLEREGAVVTGHPDGLAALEAFQRAPDDFEAALLDLTMPRMGGTEALLAMRKLRPNLPAMLSSGYDVDDTVGPLLELDGIEFIQKPYRSAQLIERLAALLV